MNDRAVVRTRCMTVSKRGAGMKNLRPALLGSGEDGLRPRSPCVVIREFFKPLMRHARPRRIKGR